MLSYINIIRLNISFYLICALSNIQHTELNKGSILTSMQNIKFCIFIDFPPFRPKKVFIRHFWRPFLCIFHVLKNTKIYFVCERYCGSKCIEMTEKAKTWVTNIDIFTNYCFIISFYSNIWRFPIVITFSREKNQYKK